MKFLNRLSLLVLFSITCNADDTQPSLTLEEKKEHLYQKYTENILNNSGPEKYIRMLISVSVLRQFKPLSQKMKLEQNRITQNDEAIVSECDMKELLSHYHALFLEKCRSKSSSSLEQAQCKSIRADITWFEKFLNKTVTEDDIMIQSESKAQLALVL